MKRTAEKQRSLGTEKNVNVNVRNWQCSIKCTMESSELAPGLALDVHVCANWSRTNEIKTRHRQWDVIVIRWLTAAKKQANAIHFVYPIDSIGCKDTISYHLERHDTRRESISCAAHHVTFIFRPATSQRLTNLSTYTVDTTLSLAGRRRILPMPRSPRTNRIMECLTYEHLSCFASAVMRRFVVYDWKLGEHMQIDVTSPTEGKKNA